MGIGGDEIRDANTALLEPDDELAPVDLGLGEGAGDTKDDALAVIPPYSNGNEGGAVAHVTGDTDFVVGGVKEEMGDLGKKAGAPFFELLIEGGGRFETWVEETSKPQSSPITLVTRRVLTPWMYISAMAALRERSLRLPFSSNEVLKGASLPRT